MRQVMAIGLLAMISCTTPPTSPAMPARAEVIGSYRLTVLGGTVGTITSAVRCGTTLYLGDVESKLHRLDLTDGRVLPPLINDTVLPMALAADCERGNVWVVSPFPRGGGVRAMAFAIESGKVVREWSIATPCFATSAVVSGDELFVGGECIQGSVQDYVVPPAAAYYVDKRIGARVSLTSGESRPGLAPFETACHGAGACVGGSVARAGSGWIASLPVSSRIGIYSSDGELTRTIPVASPGFVSDGTRLAVRTGSDQRVLWSTRNTLIHRVFAVSDRLVVAHYVTEVPPGWTIALPERPQFKVRMNILTLDGELTKPDVDLPELPVGADDEALYVVDYGAKGRQGAHESVTVLRIAIPK